MTDSKSIGFSIVIVNYNMAKYLDDALTSIILQQYGPKQIIVIDGGSTDSSLDIIKKHSSDIDYWISEPDKGQSDAFNKGFQKAKYDWLFWLNADDFLTANALSHINDLMKKALTKEPERKWFCFDSLMSNEQGVCTRALYGANWNWILNHLGPLVHSATTIFHRELFEKSAKFDLKLYWSMDLDLWVQFFKLGYTYKTIHTFAYVIRTNEQSKTFSNGLKYNPSDERKRQSAYMWEKNHFKPDLKYLPLWRIFKAFTILLPNIFYNWSYKGKKLIWWDAHQQINKR